MLLCFHSEYWASVILDKPIFTAVRVFPKRKAIGAHADESVRHAGPRPMYMAGQSALTKCIDKVYYT